MQNPTYDLIPDQNASDFEHVIVRQTVQPETPPTPPPQTSQITVAGIDEQIAAKKSAIAGIQDEIDALDDQRAKVLAVAKTATLATES